MNEIPAEYKKLTDFVKIDQRPIQGKREDASDADSNQTKAGESVKTLICAGQAPFGPRSAFKPNHFL